MVDVSIALVTKCSEEQGFKCWRFHLKRKKCLGGRWSVVSGYRVRVRVRVRV